MSSQTLVDRREANGAAWRNALRALMARPYLVVALLVVGIVAGTSLPWLFNFAPYGRLAVEQQIDREDSALCEKFGFAPGTRRATDCRADLADLRHRHEALLAL